MKRSFIYTIFIIATLLLFNTDLFAQGCVQCRMGPSSNLEGGGNVARGINSGILYLMLIPYLLIMSIVGYVFRKQLSEKWLLIKTFFGRKAIQH
jgi:hypothetical protein